MNILLRIHIRQIFWPLWLQQMQNQPIKSKLRIVYFWLIYWEYWFSFCLQHSSSQFITPTFTMKLHYQCVILLIINVSPYLWQRPHRREWEPMVPPYGIIFFFIPLAFWTLFDTSLPPTKPCNFFNTLKNPFKAYPAALETFSMWLLE